MESINAYNDAKKERDTALDNYMTIDKNNTKKIEENKAKQEANNKRIEKLNSSWW